MMISRILYRSVLLSALIMVAGVVDMNAAQFTWTPGNNSGDSATWDTSSANWSGGAATLWDAVNGPNNDALFSTAPAVTVSGTVFTNGIEFTTGSVGTTISGGTIHLAGTSPFISFSGSTTTGGAGSTASVATINSVIDGSGGLSFTAVDSTMGDDQSRRLTLNGANTYTGVTLVGDPFRDYFRLRAGSSTAFGPANSASLAWDAAGGQKRQIVELFGNDMTVIGLNYAGGNDGGPPAFGAFLYNTHPTDDATLTLDTSTGDSTFNGAMRDEGGGKLGLTVIGGGKLTVLGHNHFYNYTGGLSVLDGMFSSNRSNANGEFGTGGLITLGSVGKTGTLEFRQTGGTIDENILLGAGGTGEFAVLSGTAPVSGIVSGDGDLTKTGAGGLTLSNVNTYTGDTTVSAGTLTLEDNAGLLFEIGASGINNGISGTGTLILLGDFTFDLTGAGTTLGDNWNIVDVGTLNETYGGTFTVNGFADIGGDEWEFISGPTTYTFSEATGVLAVTAAASLVPEPQSILLAGVGLLGLVGLTRLRRRRN